MKNVLWEPYGEYLTNSNIACFINNHKIKDYEELVKKSTSDAEWFWDAPLRLKKLNLFAELSGANISVMI